MKRPTTAPWQGTLHESGGPAGASHYVLKSMEEVHARCLSLVLNDPLTGAGSNPRDFQMTAELNWNNLRVRGWIVTSSQVTLVAKSGV